MSSVVVGRGEYSFIRFEVKNTNKCKDGASSENDRIILLNQKSVFIFLNTSLYKPHHIAS